MKQRGWGALSTEEVGRRNPSQQAAGECKSGDTCLATRMGKLGKVAVGGKLHRRGGKTHLTCELQINTQA
jgi:hypothetical protein